MNNKNINNPNNDAYWKKKGYDSRPANWRNNLTSQKSKRQLNREKYCVDLDGGYTEPLCKDDY